VVRRVGVEDRVGSDEGGLAAPSHLAGVLAEARCRNQGGVPGSTASAIAARIAASPPGVGTTASGSQSTYSAAASRNDSGGSTGYDRAAANASRYALLNARRNLGVDVRREIQRVGVVAAAVRFAFEVERGVEVHWSVWYPVESLFSSRSAVRTSDG